jgi:hypothetical protein
MKRWQWALLLFELVLFAVILVLPQVNLPDFAFHGGTAPVAAKARVSSPPVQSFAAPLALPSAPPLRIREAAPEADSAVVSPHTDSRLSLLCVRLC